MPRLLPIALPLVLALAASGCSNGVPPRAPGLPPTPKSITKENPGGDAADPEEAALGRLLSEPWGHRKDRFNTLHVPLADWKKWRRVRIWNHPTRATYRYGDDHYAVATVLYTPITGPNDPDACLADLWGRNAPVADAYGVRLGESQLLRTTQEVDGITRPLLVKILDGSIESVFASDDYLGAIAVYQSWPDTCLSFAFAVKAGEHRDLALKVRERWIQEAAPKLTWLKKVTEAPETKAR